MGEQKDMQTKAVQWLADEDEERWKEYWKAQGQPWRKKPVIDAERQKYLEALSHEAISKIFS